MKRKAAVVLTAIGEAGMFYFGAVIILAMVSWLLSIAVNTLKLNGFLHNLPLFIFITGLFAFMVFVLVVLYKAIKYGKRFIDVFEDGSEDSLVVVTGIEKNNRPEARP